MITFICHLRLDNDDRLRNLKSILKYYTTNIPNCKFIIVEDDSKHNNDLKFLKEYKNNVKLVFMHNPNLWYKTKALNVGVKYAETEIVCQLDVDCIFNCESIVKCAEFLLSNDEYQFAYPYNGYIIDLGFDYYSLFEKSDYSYSKLIELLPPREKLTLGYGDENLIVRCTDTEHQGVGGIAMFKTSYYKKAGGYNEKFFCWGAEDNELIERLEKLGYKNYRITDKDSIGFHLPHRNAIRHNNPFYQYNVDEFNKVKSMNKQDLEKYIASWSMYNEKNSVL
jgi:hypothetical protein